MKDYSYRNLHRRAAEYYRTVRHRDEPSSIEELEPQLLEFDHLILAQDFEAATSLMNEIGETYLVLWGFLERIVEMRSKLLDCIDDSSLRVNNLLSLADAYRMMGQTQKAISACTSALKIAEQTSDKSLVCKAFCTLGGIYRKCGQYADAIENLEQALILARELSQSDVELQASMQLGQILYYINRVEEARAILSDAFTLAQEVDNRRMQADLKGQLGYTALWLGHTDQAIGLCADALCIAEEVSNKRGRGYWHLGLGEGYLVSKQLDKAEQNFIAAERIANEISDNHLKTYAGSFLAQALLYEGKLAKSLEYIAKLRKIDNPPHNDFMAMLHGLILARLGRVEEAIRALDEALALNTSLIEKNPTSLLEAQCTRGVICLALALLQTANSVTFSYLLDAQEILRRTFEDTVAEGVVKRFMDIIDEMRVLDSHSSISLIINSLGRTMKENLTKTGVFVELHVNSFDIAIDFYSKLGFVTVLRTHDHGGYLTMRKNTSIMNFYGGSDIINEHPFFKQFPPTSPPGYRVEIVIPVENVAFEFETIRKAISVQALVEELKERPWGRRDFRIRDPFGFYLRFTEKIDWLEP